MNNSDTGGNEHTPMDPNIGAIGTRIVNIRKALTLNQKELAAGLDSLPSSISNIETGRNNPTVPMLCMLSTRYNASLDYILLGRGPMFKESDELHTQAKQVIELDDVSDMFWLLKNSPLFRGVIFGVAAQEFAKDREAILEDAKNYRARSKK